MMRSRAACARPLGEGGEEGVVAVMSGRERIALHAGALDALQVLNSCL